MMQRREKRIKRGDLLPAIRVTLGSVREGVRTVANLTGLTVKFVMRKEGSTEPAIYRALTAGEIIDAANGQVEYQWESGDTDNLGNYLVEFEVENLSNKKLTYWDLRTAAQMGNEDPPKVLMIKIVADLDQ